MITTKQRASLRALANALEPSMQIGKEGLSENSVVQVDQMLEAKELVKIKVLQNCDESVKDLAISLAKATNSEVVQTIGKMIVLYRFSKKVKQNIML